MKVIDAGDPAMEWPRRMTCPKCFSLLAVDLADIKRNADYTGDFTSWFIDCPSCSEQPDVPRDWWDTVTRLKREESQASARLTLFGAAKNVVDTLTISPDGVYDVRVEAIEQLSEVVQEQEAKHDAALTIVSTAVAWYERITDYPGIWGDDTDLKLVKAVEEYLGTHKWYPKQANA